MSLQCRSKRAWRFPSGMFFSHGLALLVFALMFAPYAGAQDGGSPAKPPASLKPALTVMVTTPQSSDWPQTISAQGNIAAWQEAVIGSELSGFRVAEVLVDVGDRVRKGQVLARLSADTVTADAAQAQASVAEGEAALAEAQANATRTRDLGTKGFVSSYELIQAATAEQTAAARLAAARARLQMEQVRLAQTRITAPDDGVISARIATVGSLAQTGQDLFKLIRSNRMEWRAEVTAAEADRLKPAMPVTVWLPSGAAVKGSVRTVAPTVDAQTRMAIVYVDLPASGTGLTVRPGTFTRGEFQLGHSPALSVPQSAVLLQEGFSYVFRIDDNSRVARVKVTVGRRTQDRIEIIDGLSADSRVVATGAGFLSDGDSVRVVENGSPP